MTSPPPGAVRRRACFEPGRSAGLLGGYLADLLLADPARWHPVAGFGRAALALEQASYADSRRRGVFHVVACTLPVVGVGGVAQRWGRRWQTPMVAVLTWAVLGGASLRREARALASALDGGDLAAARRRLPSLCGRDPAALDCTELARAAVESLAENTADAVVAPLWWGAVAGVPGLVGYRVVNTLDAMVGHRSARYARFGWAAARLDDVVNLVPARLTAVLTVAVAPLVGADAAGAWRTWRRDGRRHPSPNGGQCEAAFAGALGLRLGGRNVYAGRVEDRPTLGAGRAPLPADVARAARLAAAVALAAVLLAAGLAAALLTRPEAAR
jgi:adenosylcobinamide-phosphate synthase